MNTKPIESADCTPAQIKAVRAYCDREFPAGPHDGCMFGKNRGRSCNWMLCGPEIEAGLAAYEARQERS